MGRKCELVGERFGRLVVLSEIPTRNAQGKVMWRCLCDCGGFNTLSSSTLNMGLVKSCGCLKAETKSNFTHGMSKTKTYYAYEGMKSRCLNKSDKSYKDYGARGIIVCERWLGPTGFVNFLEDMGKSPSKGHTIDRINNDQGYSASNCRWTSYRVQAINRRMTSRNNTGITGVAWDSKGKCWRARIQIEGKTKVLGSFHSFFEACCARKSAEVTHYKPLLEEGFVR